MNARQTLLRALALLLPLLLVLPGCGGGAKTTTITTTTGGGSTSGGIGTTLPHVCTPTNEQFLGSANGSGANIAPVYVDNCATAGTLAASNIPYVSVYVCGGANTCAWIDHIQIDTGSVGLRVLAAAIPAGVLSSMPVVTNPASGPNAVNMGECYQFVLSYFWGGLRQATIKMGGVPSSTGSYAGNVASQNPTVIHVLNDPSLPASAPTTCATAAGTGSSPETSAAAIGANGVLGIGLYPDDSNSAAIYYQCADMVADNCTKIGTPSNPITTAQVVPNPATAMGINGTSLTLDTAAGIRSRAVAYNSYGVTLPDGTPLTNTSAVAGYLTLGIPASGSGSPAHIFVADTFSQRISASVAGKTFTSSANGTGSSAGAFIDSGSNSYFYTQTDLPFATLALNTCTDNSFTCESPAGTSNHLQIALVLSAVGTTPTVGSSNTSAYQDPGGLVFYDADYLFRTYFYSPVYEGLAAIQADPTPTTPPAPPAPPNPFLGQFDLGLPYFFGRTVYFGVWDGSNPATAFYGL